MIKADKVFYNGNFYTMKREGDRVQALAVLNGLIVFAGSNEEAAEIPAEERIDLEGRTVLPGFTDTHIHLMMDAAERLKVDLSGARSIPDIIAAMKEKAEETKGEDGWLLGCKVHMEDLREGRFPGRRELDEITLTRPVYIYDYSLHAGMVNSKALEIAGIGKGFVPEVPGTVEFDGEGEPSGIIRETALKYFEPHMGLKTDDPAFRKALMEKIAPQYSKLGLTTIHTFSAITGDVMEYIYMYQEMAEEGTLPFRIRINTIADLPRSIGAVSGVGTDMVKYGAKKIFCDGSLSSRSAALMEPYSDAPDTKGVLMYSQEELNRQVLEAYDYGMEVAIHAIGDMGLEYVLRAVENCMEKTVNVRKGTRIRIIHDLLASEEQIERMKKLPVILDIQPIFLKNWTRIAVDRLGEERMNAKFMPYRRYLDAGLIVTAGSDAPVDGCDPLVGIQLIVTRKDLTGYPPEGLVMDQAVTVYEAVDMFTGKAAYCTNEENIKGTLEPGKYADLVVLSRDIFETAPEEIADIEVLRTVVGGRTVYKKSC